MQIELPTVQRWSCHNCSGCCRQHLIEITPAEEDRIRGQNWTAEELGTDLDPITSSGPPWDRTRHLAHRDDGACVFLNDQGLCRIHAKFGENAKPLACRVYPYAVHPARSGVAVSLRYSCPSVTANLGKPVAHQRQEIKTIVRGVTAGKAVASPAPLLTANGNVEWADFDRVTAFLIEKLCDGDGSVIDRLRTAIAWSRLLGDCQLADFEGERLLELIELLWAGAEGDVSESSSAPEPISRTGRLLFRMRVVMYARTDTGASRSAGWIHRWRMVRSAWRFARGRGDVPVMGTDLRPIPFDDLDRSFGLPDGTDELWTRYFRTKLEGNHLCGPALYWLPLTRGLQATVLFVAVTHWIAGWIAASDDRNEITLDDLREALNRTDHQHGYNPRLGTRGAIGQIATLTDRGDTDRLLRWYCGPFDPAAVGEAATEK